MANTTPSLTDDERACVKEAGALWNRLCQIVGSGPTRNADLGEMIIHIHAIQQFVMAQAAGRAFPAEFRLAGEILHAAPEPELEIKRT